MVISCYRDLDGFVPSWISLASGRMGNWGVETRCGRLGEAGTLFTYQKDPLIQPQAPGQRITGYLR